MSGLVATAYANRYSGTAPNYAPAASLTTPTYDGSGQTTEPTFRKKPPWVTIPSCTHILAHNPLTGGSAAVENPSLLYSTNNGSTWAVPPGLSTTAPIYGPPATGNYADCYIWDDSVNGSNTLHLFWLSSETGGIGIWHGSSSDPALVTWSVASRLNTISGNFNEPKVIWDPRTSRYFLFMQDFVAAPYFIKYQTATTIAGLTSTSAWTPINMTIPNVQGFQQGPWHFDIIREAASGRWILTFSSGYGQAITTGMQAWVASSWDGMNWKCALRPFMYGNSWTGTAQGIYRPSIQPAATGSGYDCVVAGVQGMPGGPHLGLTRNVPASEIP